VARFAATADPHLPGAHATAAVGAWRRADFDRARVLAERGIELAAAAGHPQSARFAWEALRSTELLAGNYERSLACRDQALALARAAGDAAHQAHAHAVGALALGYLGKADDAVGELAAATELLAGCDHPTTRALCDYVAGENRLESAPREAIPLLHRSRDTARRVGNRFLASVAGLSAVSCAARLGDPTEAFGEYAELIEYFHRAGAWTQLWTTIRTLIETLTRLGHDDPAAVLHGALCATGTGAPITGADAIRLAQAATTLRARLGDETFTRLQGEGAALGDERAADYALRLVGDRPSP
jgi:tetratricopeptide (TPR) repeat protein